MKPKFTPRISLRCGGGSRAKANVARGNYNEKMKQIENAIMYCQENNCKGKKALSTGQFPLIKDHKTITRRLDGDVVHGSEKLHVSILLPSEEECLVNFAKNKARAMQPLKRNDMNRLITNMLRMRQAANKKLKGGRKYAKLSDIAVNVLAKGKVIKKKQQKENFVRCKGSCVCKEQICKAAGLKECSVCGDVMKSQCSKARCTVEGNKPMMKLSWYDTDKKLNRSKAVSKGKRKGTKQIQAEDDTAN